MKCTQVWGTAVESVLALSLSSNANVQETFSKANQGIEVRWFETEMLPKLVFRFLLDISVIIIEVN